MQIFHKRLDKFSCPKVRTENNESERDNIIQRFNNAIDNIAPPPSKVNHSHEC